MRTPPRSSLREAGQLLRPELEMKLHPITGEALLTALDEEDLDLEERLQRCQKDARQLVPVKPDLAWARARQAVALVGRRDFDRDLRRSFTDHRARLEAYLTLAEVSFQIAVRKKHLAPELGKIDMYDQAADGARNAGRSHLSSAIHAVGRAERALGTERLNEIAGAIRRINEAREELPAWFTTEINAKALQWLDELEQHIEAGDNPLTANDILPPFFDILGFPDAAARKERLAQRSVHILMKNRRFAQALTILEQQPEPNRKLVAECYEETSQFAKAAAVWLEFGDRNRALRCFRSIPDFAASLKLVREIEGHAAGPSLEWLAELDALVAKRPDNFNRAVLAPEKRILEEMLERALGVQRKKPTLKKKAATTGELKKAPVTKKAVPVKAVRPRRSQKEVF